MISYNLFSVGSCLQLTSLFGHLSTSASRMVLSFPSLGVIIAHWFSAPDDCRMAWEKRGREPGDRRWKATDAEPADSGKEKKTQYNKVINQRGHF